MPAIAVSVTKCASTSSGVRRKLPLHNLYSQVLTESGVVAGQSKDRLSALAHEATQAADVQVSQKKGKGRILDCLIGRLQEGKSDHAARYLPLRLQELTTRPFTKLKEGPAFAAKAGGKSSYHGSPDSFRRFSPVLIIHPSPGQRCRQMEVP